jgi:hypothetical protein
MKNTFYESKYGKIHYHLIGSGDLPYLVLRTSIKLFLNS